MSDQSPYTINVEDAGPARKRVSVTISSSAVDAQLQQQLAAVSASVQLPGFRKGKVPRAVVEKRFGEAIGDETRNEIVKEALQQAIAENEFDLLNNPEPTEETLPVVERG
ncbi:MAG: trigger factor family protein, partial [Phycisphaerales bacterium]|nr:trigger factor family protein [Phycisphaerales bacterium]